MSRHKTKKGRRSKRVVSRKHTGEIKIVGNGEHWIRKDMLTKPNKNITMCGDSPDVECDVFLQIEPEIHMPRAKYLMDNYKKYKYIFTYNADVLKKCPNAKLCIYGTSWIQPSDYEKLPEKKWLITSVTGLNSQHVGHKLRRAVYDQQDKLPKELPIQFYRSCKGADQLKDFGHNPILKTAEHDPDCNDTHANKGAKFECLKESQFHIAIENSRQENYFTEKLCDALITKNIPIYYGCPNISKFFDTSGWIIMENEDVDALYKRLSALDKDYYQKHLSTVNKNFKKVMKYKDYEASLNECLDKCRF